MDAAKQEFLNEFGEHYGYPNAPKSIDQIRATEFKRLQGHIILICFHFRISIKMNLINCLNLLVSVEN